MPKGHQNPISQSKVTAILLKGLILPIGGASVVEVLRSTGLPRLVYNWSGESGGVVSNMVKVEPVGLHNININVNHSFFSKSALLTFNHGLSLRQGPL